MTETITLPRAVVEQVREALLSFDNWWDDEADTALAALDAALAEPEQKPEPVAWLWKDGFRFLGCIEPKDGSELPLYAAPPKPDAKREPATEEQIIASWPTDLPYLLTPHAFYKGFRAAERFHGIRKEDGK